MHGKEIKSRDVGEISNNNKNKQKMLKSVCVFFCFCFYFFRKIFLGNSSNGFENGKFRLDIHAKSRGAREFSISQCEAFII